MNITQFFIEEDKRLNAKRIGCDYCGLPAVVVASKAGRANNWQRQWLCEECQEIVKIENQIMKQQTKGGDTK